MPATNLWKMPADVPIGHKLARTVIPTGAKIVKYGAPIGSATAPIARGELVVMHGKFCVRITEFIAQRAAA